MLEICVSQCNSEEAIDNQNDVTAWVNISSRDFFSQICIEYNLGYFDPIHIILDNKEKTSGCLLDTSTTTTTLLCRLHYIHRNQIYQESLLTKHHYSSQLCADASIKKSCLLNMSAGQCFCLSETSVKPPGKLFIFIVTNRMYRVTVSQI